tara:strand:- start:1665 stop:1880 length:216 start_codon:yes stop_codon:yes gene_type:complete
MKDILHKHESLITLLAAIVKQHNNKLEISEKELCKVTLSDCLTAEYNKKTGNLILCVTNVEKVLNTTKSLN